MACDDLGRHPLERADAARGRIVVHLARLAKVGQLGAFGQVQLDVARLEVAVDHGHLERVQVHEALRDASDARALLRPHERRGRRLDQVRPQVAQVHEIDDGLDVGSRGQT